MKNTEKFYFGVNLQSMELKKDTSFSFNDVRCVCVFFFYYS